MNRFFLIIIIIFLNISHLTAKKFDQLQFVRYTTEHGLPVGTVWKVYQDSCGYIWFGTENGLTFFDGLQFKTFSTSSSKTKSLSNNKIYDIIQGHNKKTYIATAEGINVFDKISGNFSVLEINDTVINYQNQPVRSLFVESDSILLAGYQTLGLVRINLKTKKATNVKLADGNLYVRSIAKTEDQKYLISTFGKGFFVVDQNGKIENYRVCENHKDPIELEGRNRVNQVFDYDKKQYLLATERGLFWFDKRNKTISEVAITNFKNKNGTAPQVRRILRDSNNNIWIATYAGLLFIENNNIEEGHLFETQENSEYCISSNRLLDIMEDRGGSIWVSNFDVGVNVIHGTDVRFHHVCKSEAPNSLPANIVTAFEKLDNRRMLIGTTGGGISIFNLDTDEFINLNQKYKTLSSRVLSIHKDKAGIIWIGTWGEGLQKLDIGTGKVSSYKKGHLQDKSLDNNTVIQIVQDDMEHLWIATFSGLNRLNIKTNEIEQFNECLGIGNTAIYAIFKDLDNSIWLGTNGKGLILFNPKSKSVERYVANESDSLSIASNTIYYITKDTQGNYYIGTEKGISVLKSGANKFYTIDESHGISNNIVWAIIEDSKQNFWISGNKGITRYNSNIEISNPEAFKTYGRKDGLRSLEFSQGAYYYDKNLNLIYFGGIQGFYYFNPLKIEPRKFAPEIQITSIKVMDNEYVSDTSVTFMKSLTLPYSKNFLSFEFVSLDYFEPTNNLFQFKLSGQTEKWSQPSTRNYVSFPDLKEGSYVLHIRGTNSEGYWSDKQRSIQITITPPWWRTNIAYVSYVLAIIIGVVSFVRWRTYKLAHEKKVLEAIVAERTKELKQKNEDITASIQYARRIQQAIIFPKITEFLRVFTDSFVFFKPKDIVSGDFFWYGKKDNRQFFAAADCTGHGVPGAFMSIIGNNLLEKVVYEYGMSEPHEILTQLDKEVKRSLGQKGRRNDTFDGMDIALCAIDEGSNKLLYSGAYRQLILIRNNEVIQYKPTRGSIGGSQIKQEKIFTTETIDLQKNDAIYIYSDGITDQFGGPQNRKFSSSNLYKTLLELQDKTMLEQEVIIESIMREWLEGYVQIDDIILTGVRF
ncbi:MAG TPA: two-component regulator propeller domain-containing protein [Salinivirgaceae bacterium]|nr:two-component regulator propeller domain-containing protein [Salinivirgaceae bacterium]